MTARVLGFLVLLLALAPSGQAQTLPVQLDLDAGSYLYGGGQSLLEIYVSVGVHTLEFEASEEGYGAQLPVTLSVYPASNGAPDNVRGAAAFEQALDLQFVIPDPALLTNGREYVEQVRATLAPGEYDVIASVAADGDRPSFEVRLNDVVVPDYEAASGAAISSIQLASSIARAEEGATDFVKSGLEIQPNPTTVFAMAEGETGGMRSVPYYAEIYGVDDAIDAASYTVLAYLSQSNRPYPLPEHQHRTERPTRAVDVVVGRFDISDLASGTYWLRIAALNEANEPVAERGQKLYVVNPNVEAEVLYAEGEDFESLLFAGLSEEEIDLELDQIQTIATGRELDVSGGLRGLDAKRAFLAAFWRGRDDNPNPNVNGARRRFFQRMSIVQDRYREPLVEGFRTERGRVFLKYGPPSQVDERRFEAETIPHILWSYDNIPGEGRAVFVFADRYSSGRLELIHSDVTGEISVPNWQDQLIRIR
jgi:GWxTD domain-containing protein